MSHFDAGTPRGVILSDLSEPRTLGLSPQNYPMTYAELCQRFLPRFLPVLAYTIERSGVRNWRPTGAPTSGRNMEVSRGFARWDLFRPN